MNHTKDSLHKDYQRIMSGGATPKELANILQAYVACNENGGWVYFWTRPSPGRNKWSLNMQIENPSFSLNFGNPLLDLPPCSCHWTDSLIVPEGLEEENIDRCKECGATLKEANDKYYQMCFPCRIGEHTQQTGNEAYDRFNS